MSIPRSWNNLIALKPMIINPEKPWIMQPTTSPLTDWSRHDVVHMVCDRAHHKEVNAECGCGIRLLLPGETIEDIYEQATDPKDHIIIATYQLMGHTWYDLDSQLVRASRAVHWGLVRPLWMELSAFRQMCNDIRRRMPPTAVDQHDTLQQAYNLIYDYWGQWLGKRITSRAEVKRLADEAIEREKRREAREAEEKRLREEREAAQLESQRKRAEAQAERTRRLTELADGKFHDVWEETSDVRWHIQGQTGYRNGCSKMASIRGSSRSYTCRCRRHRGHTGLHIFYKEGRFAIWS